jgi:hypothetical protein
MLYMATTDEQPVFEGADLSVEAVEPAREAVRQWLTLPHVRFVGAHTKCSCGFPSVMAEEPIEHYDGMPLDQSDNREADLRSVRALFELLRTRLRAGPVELLPVADGEEQLATKGTIHLTSGALDADTFFFNERYLYRLDR